MLKETISRFNLGVMSRSNGITKSERKELIALAKKRERVAKNAAVHRSAKLRADFEKQLDTKYRPEDDPLWKELYKHAEQVVKETEQALAQDCRAKGIPEQCAPRIQLNWWDRGRNTFKNERTEMRRVAYSRIDELEKVAKFQIERVSLEIQTELAAGALESDEARIFLERMPSADQLMPTLKMGEIEKQFLLKS
jgi:hypothetical protein